MALQKTATIDGATGNYWRLTYYSQDTIHGHTLVQLRLYTDRAARDADLSVFIVAKTYRLSTLDNLRSGIYTQLKALADFSDAEDA